MGMKRRRGIRIFQEVATPLVHVVGDDLRCRIEPHDGSRNPDHFWITTDPGFSFRVTISVNTWSRRNADAGFDPRVRLGILRGFWDQLPERGVNECHHFGYEELPGHDTVDYRPLERVVLEQLLLAHAEQARMIEVWGAPYHRDLPGIHQIHSRRASCGVAESREGADGALRFYFREGRRMETLLFKFCGQ
jgi:hypothetical protein